MDAIVGDVLTKLGVPSVVALVLYFIIKEMIKNKTNELETKAKEVTDLQRQAAQNSKEEIELKLSNLIQERELKLNGIIENYKELKGEFEMHIQHHHDYEKDLFDSINRLYDRINPKIDILNKIEGWMEAQNARSL